jgi:acyl carrier protein
VHTTGGWTSEGRRSNCANAVNGTLPDNAGSTPVNPALEQEISALIVEALMLEDVAPGDIDPVAPLFGDGPDGLGLDSIDVLELAMALNKRYGVKTQADDDRNQEIFATVRNLAGFVAAQRVEHDG